ncbi:MAG: NAD(P)H-hydrate dehydratase [Jatrophihabitans sp.]|uniref:NAD(P)H-hydrate dehydratase n=1 Tax=Jatrophihabitans sp. TaxID=1932789 RepID=UPI003F811D62
MRGTYSVAQIREAEASLMATMPEGALMQRAASALAVECARVLGRVYGARVVLLVGGGNNGGDALYAGARLARRGAAVSAMLLSPGRAHAEGLAALRAAGGRVVPSSAAVVAQADLVVDGIVGIGGSPGLRGEAVGLTAAARAVPTVAVDLPSGIDADTGEAGADVVHADVTVTFGALKAGLVAGDGPQYAGEVHVVDIGLSLPEPSVRVLEAADVAALLPVPGFADDKYTRGVIGVVAGSSAYGGAGVLCTGSAAVGGAGFVRYAGSAPDAIRARYPEVVVQSGTPLGELRVQAWTVGPGIGTDGAALGLVREALATDVPVLLDADAITVVAQDDALRSALGGRSAPVVVTPHDREFERLVGSAPGADRVGAARAAAAELGVVVLLQGNATVVAAPDGPVFVNPPGTPWLGTAGSGDVLSGLIGSLLASGLDAPVAAAVGAYVHGVAGQLAAADGPPTSLDVLNAVRPALATVARTR